MSAPAMRLDFAASGRKSGRGPMLLLAAGATSVILTILSYQQFRAQAEGLELRLEALTGSQATRSLRDSEGDKTVSDAAVAIAELATPWGQLLRDLEAAAVDSQKSVALLAIEPDRESHKVTITAESRTLPAAVAFAERLQHSEALLDPLLDNHEVQADAQYRPVRFQITASWRIGS
jgi:hypothetical protein